MTIPRNRPLFKQLAKGVADKNVLDDDSFHPKNIFQKFTWDFSNESIKIDLLSNATDVDGWDSFDANDPTRARIHRDCELYYYAMSFNFISFLFSHFYSYFYRYMDETCI